MHNLIRVSRSLLGLAFVVFGLNYFLDFLPAPKHPGAAGDFLGALVTGKVLAVAKLIEIAAGLALLGNRFVPLALTLLAPVLVNIVLFHAVFEPAGLPVPALLVALELAVAWAYRDAFAPMLRARVSPRGVDRDADRGARVDRRPGRPRSVPASAA